MKYFVKSITLVLSKKEIRIKLRLGDEGAFTSETIKFDSLDELKNYLVTFINEIEKNNTILIPNYKSRFYVMYQNYIKDLYRKKPELLTNNDWIVEAVENIVKYFNRWTMFYGRKKEYYVSLKNDSNKQELAHKLTFKKGIFNVETSLNPKWEEKSLTEDYVLAHKEQLLMTHNEAAATYNWLKRHGYKDVKIEFFEYYL